MSVRDRLGLDDAGVLHLAGLIEAAQGGFSGGRAPELTDAERAEVLEEAKKLRG